jgi:hypothetical protein
MNVQMRRLIVAILSFGIWSDVLLAESDESEGGYEANLAGVFVGVTGENRRENGFTLALTYERRFSESFGVGVEAERVFGDLEFWLATVPFAYHYKAWKLFAGPGIEMPDDADNEFLVRIGGEYAFEAGRWEIAPVLAVDFVDSETEVVAGLGFLYGF